jgi:hypothetical protein
MIVFLFISLLIILIAMRHKQLFHLFCFIIVLQLSYKNYKYNLTLKTITIMEICTSIETLEAK